MCGILPHQRERTGRERAASPHHSQRSIGCVGCRSNDERPIRSKPSPSIPFTRNTHKFSATIRPIIESRKLILVSCGDSPGHLFCPHSNIRILAPISMCGILPHQRDGTRKSVRNPASPLSRLLHAYKKTRSNNERPIRSKPSLRIRGTSKNQLSL